MKLGFNKLWILLEWKTRQKLQILMEQSSTQLALSKQMPYLAKKNKSVQAILHHTQNRNAPIRVSQHLQICWLSVCLSVIFLVSWTADLPFADFPFFVFFCPSFAFLSVHLSSLFLVCCLFFCLFFWQDLDEAQYGSRRQKFYLSPWRGRGQSG